MGGCVSTLSLPRRSLGRNPNSNSSLSSRLVSRVVSRVYLPRPGYVAAAQGTRRCCTRSHAEVARVLLYPFASHCRSSCEGFAVRDLITMPTPPVYPCSAQLAALMGTDDTAAQEMEFSDPQVCKSFLCGGCPNDLVENTVRWLRSGVSPPPCSLPAHTAVHSEAGGLRCTRWHGRHCRRPYAVLWCWCAEASRTPCYDAPQQHACLEPGLLSSQCLVHLGWSGRPVHAPGCVDSCQGLWHTCS